MPFSGSGVLWRCGQWADADAAPWKVKGTKRRKNKAGATQAGQGKTEVCDAQAAAPLAAQGMSAPAADAGTATAEVGDAIQNEVKKLEDLRAYGDPLLEPAIQAVERRVAELRSQRDATKTPEQRLARLTHKISDHARAIEKKEAAAAGLQGELRALQDRVNAAQTDLDQRRAALRELERERLIRPDPAPVHGQAQAVPAVPAQEALFSFSRAVLAAIADESMRAAVEQVHAQVVGVMSQAFGTQATQHTQLDHGDEQHMDEELAEHTSKRAAGAHEAAPTPKRPADAAQGHSRSQG